MRIADVECENHNSTNCYVGDNLTLFRRPLERMWSCCQWVPLTMVLTLRMRRLTSGLVSTLVVHIFTAISLPVQELHRGDEAARSIRLSAQPALDMSREGCIYGSSRNMHSCISEIGNQEQALGIWQISYRRIAKQCLKIFSSFPFRDNYWTTLFFFIRTSFFFRRLHVLIFKAKWSLQRS